VNWVITYDQLAQTFSPGEFINEELEARGWSQRDLSEIMGVPPSVVSGLVSGTKSVTLGLARNLAAAFGNSAQHWINLEVAYRLSKTPEKYRATGARSEIFNVAPVYEMIKRGWIPRSDNIEVLRASVLNFFGVSELREVENAMLRHQARHSRKDCKANPAQHAWVRRVSLLARSLQVKKYSPSRIAELLQRLQQLMGHAEQVRHVPKTLAEFGVRFLVVEHLSQTKIDGICLWLDEHSPVIALSLRYDRLDCFWFALFHELGHLLKGYSLRSEVKLDCDLVGERAQKSKEKSKVEQRADVFASECLIKQNEMNSFVALARPVFSSVKIRNFALRIGVHPAIVIGQLQRREEIHWTDKRKFLVWTRGIIIGSALTDGWGQTLTNVA
jgi:HTH-type transcriptional regulator/antitoxin HigA